MRRGVQLQSEISCRTKPLTGSKPQAGGAARVLSQAVITLQRALHMRLHQALCALCAATLTCMPQELHTP